MEANNKTVKTLKILQLDIFSQGRIYRIRSFDLGCFSTIAPTRSSNALQARWLHIPQDLSMILFRRRHHLSILHAHQDSNR